MTKRQNYLMGIVAGKLAPKLDDDCCLYATGIPLHLPCRCSMQRNPITIPASSPIYFGNKLAMI